MARKMLTVRSRLREIFAFKVSLLFFRRSRESDARQAPRTCRLAKCELHWKSATQTHRQPHSEVQSACGNSGTWSIGQT